MAFNYANLIAKYKEQFDANMMQHCGTYCLMGTSAESPRWYNFQEISEDNVLRIGSTQRSGLWFEIQLEGNEWMHVQNDSMAFWNAFKEYRTDFLKTNFPTIQTF